MPLHPAVVHLPLALAVLMPLAATIGLWLLWTGRASQRAWRGVVLLELLLLASGVVGLKTGERDEDAVEAVVGDRVLHQHEEYAEQFVYTTGAVLVLSLLGLVPRTGVMRGGTIATVAGTLVVAGLALRVGHAGGELVYVHGAATPHVAAAGAATTAAATRSMSDHERTR